MIQNIYKNNFVRYKKVVKTTLSYNDYQQSAKNDVYLLVQQMKDQLRLPEQRVKFLTKENQQILTIVNQKVQKPIVMQVVVTQNNKISSKYDVFQQFRKKIDYISYSVDEGKNEDSQVPLMLALNPLQRYFIPRCCIMNSYHQHILYTIQESSKVISDNAKLKLNGNYTVDLQQINYFLVHLQLYKDIYHSTAHPDLKQLVFLSHVFRKQQSQNQLAQRANSSTQIYNQFNEPYAAINDVRKTQLKTQLLKSIESSQLYIQQKIQLQSKFKREIFKAVSGLYKQKSEHYEVSHKQQMEFVEDFVHVTRDCSGQFVYNKEDILDNLLRQVVDTYLPQQQFKFTEVFVNDIKQRSCAPVWATSFLIKKIKSEQLCSFRKDQDSIKPANNQSFVGCLMLGMRNCNCELVKNGNEGHKRVLKWE